jgi:hypothetical protein
MKALARTLSLLSLAALSSCVGTEKSSNPLTPTVAGPIPGVEITAPNPVAPASGAKVAVDQQPVTLTVANASSNGPRPLTYAFEVATDTGFTNTIVSRDSITPGGGQTSLRLSDPLQTNRTYYWRSRAQDGANTGPYSSTISFNIFTPIVIGKPTLVAPGINEKVTTLQPVFTFGNAARSGPVGAISYEIEVSDVESFPTHLADFTVPEQANQTSVQLPVAAAYSKVYFWHVRAFDPTTTGPWSDTRAFSTPDAPSTGGGGGGPVGNWQNCGSTPGLQLVQCVWNAVNPAHTPESVFEVTKRVIWLLRGGGAGLLIKNGGDNIVAWRGYSFAAARLVYPDGHLFKIESDVPNGPPTWQDEGVDPSLIPLWLAPIDPNLP